MRWGRYSGCSGRGGIGRGKGREIGICRNRFVKIEMMEDVLWGVFIIVK